MIGRFGEIPPKLKALNTVVCNKNHIKVMNAVTIFLAINSPLSYSVTFCFNSRITSTSDKCSKSTTGESNPDFDRLLASIWISVT